MIKTRIKQAAKARGYENAYQFGQSIGVANMVASRIWAETELPKLKTLDKICNAWGCELSELIVHKLNGHGKAGSQKQSNKPLEKTTSGKRVRPKRAG